MRPPFETFTGPTCKGCYALGTACGQCEKCKWEKAQGAPELMGGAVTVVLPKDLRNRVGMFMMSKGCVIGAKVDCGDVQDWITEFARQEVSSILENLVSKSSYVDLGAQLESEVRLRINAEKRADQLENRLNSLV